MCGICGIIGPSDNSNRARVDRMLDRMQHRGPDGRGVWQSADRRVTLGHVRLSIQDTSDAGSQPMHHIEADLHLIINGEIYNYPNLRTELEDKFQAKFRSKSDSEVILHLAAHKKKEFIQELNGMFAFALYDNRNKHIILARDRLGIKPLYWLRYKGSIIFASEIKALFGAIYEDTWKIDIEGLSQYLTYQTTMGTRTLFSGISILEQGCSLEISSRDPLNPKINKFWSESSLLENPGINLKQSASMWRDVLSKSITRHLQSDVPISTYLSSGYDSGCVAAEASRIMKIRSNQIITAYTGCFEEGGSWYDESAPAKNLAKKYLMDHRVVNITSVDFFENIDNMIDSLDMPQMGMGALSQFIIARAASSFFKVILTGHGGDELFSGYPVFKYAKGYFNLCSTLSEVPHLVYFGLSDIKRLTSPEYGRGLPVIWSLKEQKKMIGSAIDDVEPWRLLEAIENDCTSKIEAIYRIYLKVYLHSLLIVEDKISMAHSLEARTPLLDNDMIDLSGKISQSIKLSSGNLKSVIKLGSSGLLTNDYYRQPKRGFPTPLRYWLRDRSQYDLLTQVKVKGSNLERIFCPDFINNALESFVSSWRGHFRPLDEIGSHKMWQLIALESWLRIWYHKYGVKLEL